VLGICYGMQLMSRHFGGEVVPAGKREFGHADLLADRHAGPLFDGFFVEGKSPVWMSHGDHVARVPAGFEVGGGNGQRAGLRHPGCGEGISTASSSTPR